MADVGLLTVRIRFTGLWRFRVQMWLIGLSLRVVRPNRMWWDTWQWRIAQRCARQLARSARVAA